MNKIEEVPLHKLRAFVDGKTDMLKPSEQAQLDRMHFAYTQLRYESTRATVRRIVQKYNVTERQAFKDIAQCKKLFVPLYKDDIDWLEHYIIEDIKKSIQAFQVEGNASAWNNARAQLIKMYTIMAARDTNFDIDKLGNNNYFVVVGNEGELQKIDLDKIYELPTNERVKISHSFLKNEISAEEAQKIMNDE